MTFDPIQTLGTAETSDEVRAFIAAFSPVRSEDMEPRRYLGSEEAGVDLLIEFGRVIAVQIFVQAMDSMCAYRGTLPFGLDAGMARSTVREVLGHITRIDGNSDHHLLDAIGIDLAVNYDGETQKIRYMNVMVVDWSRGR